MAEGAGRGISLSFGQNGTSKHRPKRVKVNEDAEEQKYEYVTGFSATGLQLRDQDPSSTTVDGQTKKVIPTQGNNLRGLGPRAYNPNRFLPPKEENQDGEGNAERFETAAPEEKAEVTYGLTVFGKRKAEGSAGAAEADEGEGTANGTTETGQQVKRGKRVLGTGKDWEKDAFQNDIDNLPDTASLEAYEAMPVEAFGEAMLRGMGWSEAADSSKAPQAKQFVRRAPLQGLGATAAPQSHKEKRFIKPGESRAAPKEMVVYDSEGNIKHTRTENDRLVERVVKGPAVSKTMRVTRGRHSGLLCTIAAIHAQVEGRSQTATVRLKPSEEAVTVRLKELGEKDERPQAKEDRAQSHKESRSDGHKESQSHSRHRSSGKAGHSTDAAAADREPAAAATLDRRKEGEPSGDGERPWLAPHIRVKVIDKRLGGGKLYLKKGEVTDVMAPTLCSIVLDSGERIEARQPQLETVIPKKEGARLLIVAGELKGQRAKLLKRSSETSQAAVQLTEDFSVHKLSFDQIAEFVGELGEEE